MSRMILPARTTRSLAMRVAEEKSAGLRKQCWLSGNGAEARQQQYGGREKEG
jgi:hypothetical protein